MLCKALRALVNIFIDIPDIFNIEHYHRVSSTITTTIT